MITYRVQYKSPISNEWVNQCSVDGSPYEFISKNHAESFANIIDLLRILRQETRTDKYQLVSSEGQIFPVIIEEL